MRLGRPLVEEPNTFASQGRGKPVSSVWCWPAGARGGTLLRVDFKTTRTFIADKTGAAGLHSGVVTWPHRHSPSRGTGPKILAQKRAVADSGLNRAGRCDGNPGVALSPWRNPGKETIFSGAPAPPGFFVIGEFEKRTWKIRNPAIQNCGDS